MDRIGEIHPLALRFWLVYWAVIGLLLFIFLYAVPQARYNRRAATVKQNLHSVQLALERFAVDAEDHGYPYNIDEVIAAGYLEALPLNPFSGKPMRVLENKAALSPGDFVYEPLWSPGARSTRPIGYSLHADF